MLWNHDLKDFRERPRDPEGFFVSLGGAVLLIICIALIWIDLLMVFG